MLNEVELDKQLSRPPAALVDMMGRLDGAIIILGVAGKMGVTLAIMARRAAVEAGVEKRVIGVARFSSPDARDQLEKAGVETITCDLLDREAVSRLPRAANVIFMAGRKFGTQGEEELTWALNTVVPANVAEHFRQSRIVVFSTGCVYPLTTPASGGSQEDDRPSPIGEYAQSSLGRERVFQHYSKSKGTPICLLRLNYAVEPRYGVLHDIGGKILRGETIDLSTGHFNCIWQGDANGNALLALEQCRSPAAVLNCTGPVIHSVREVALDLGRRLGREVTFSGEAGEAVYLSDATRSHELFGSPSIDLSCMLEWTAEWMSSGGRSLGKPTHFEVRDGQF